MRGISLSLMASAILPAATPAFANPYAPKLGQRHPDFTLPDIRTGKPVSLSDFRGKKGARGRLRATPVCGASLQSGNGNNRGGPGFGTTRAWRSE